MQYNVVDPQDFFQATAQLDMTGTRMMTAFRQRLPEGARVLDAGCGSGRDAAAFMRLGYDVRAFDAHPELVRLAREEQGVDARQLTFQAFDEQAAYDGIWACASLLHLTPGELPDALQRLTRALAPGGVLATSFKLGTGTRLDADGRFFNDHTAESLAPVIATIPELDLVEAFVGEDVRGRSRPWLIALAQRPA